MASLSTLILLAEATTVTASGLGWSLEYTMIDAGPVTHYNGKVTLEFTEKDPHACFEYTFEFDEGEVFGPEVGSNPGQPVLPFDSVHIRGSDAQVCWCEAASQYQVLPVEVPRFFNFSVRKTSFGPDDLTRLLAQWGQPGAWDLDGDGVVGGLDLNILISNWKQNSGEAS